MSRALALVDGNSFYRFCERVFDPRLTGVPVIVLQNDDGCAIARTAACRGGSTVRPTISSTFSAKAGCAFAGGNVWLLRQRFGVTTVKINGVSANPLRWPDGSYSVQGAATELGVTEQTVFKYLARGDLSGRQSAKGQPWQIALTPERIEVLRARAQRRKRSRRKAS